MLPKFPKFGPELTSAKIALLGFLTRALKGGRLSLFLSENKNEEVEFLYPCPVGEKCWKQCHSYSTYKSRSHSWIQYKKSTNKYFLTYKNNTCKK